LAGIRPAGRKGIVSGPTQTDNLNGLFVLTHGLKMDRGPAYLAGACSGATHIIRAHELDLDGLMMLY
jgi:hypothetical protein